MDGRWEKVYGKIKTETDGTKVFTITVWLPSSDVLGYTIRVAKSDLEMNRVNMYRFTLNSIVRKIDEVLDMMDSCLHVNKKVKLKMLDRGLPTQRLGKGLCCADCNKTLVRPQ